VSLKRYGISDSATTKSSCMYWLSLYVGPLICETIGLRGLFFLCIFGIP